MVKGSAHMVYHGDELITDHMAGYDCQTDNIFYKYLRSQTHDARVEVQLVYLRGPDT